MYRLSVSILLSMVMVMVSVGHHHHHPDNESPTVRVSTHLGEIKGSLMISEENRPIFAFRGIPYAKAPLGKLRFQNPQPIKETWKGVLDATEDADACLQKDVYTRLYIGSEDCLYLNVYSPQLPSEAIPSKKAVMFWIHGGGFIWGSGRSDLYGPTKILDHDVVLVTINYRLSVMGFLSNNSPEAPGHYGMWDIVEALRWVKDNIRHFGGDPDSVTIFGESAGSVATGYMMLQPAAAGYFHRVISQSAAATISFTSTVNPVEEFNRLAQATGCSDSEHVVNCLRQVPAAKLNIITNPVHGMRTGLRFIPTIQSTNNGETPSFLTTPPSKSFAAGEFTKVPLMIGINSDEGEFFFPYFQLMNLTPRPEELKANLPLLLGAFVPEVLDESVRGQYVEKYFPNLADMSQQQVLDAWSRAITDGLMGEPTKRLALYVSEHKVPTYVYLFDYVGNLSLCSVVFNQPFQGVPHYDDIAYLFDVPVYGYPKLEGKDREIQNRMLKLWTSFAKEGVSDRDVWSPVTPGSTELSYYRFSTNSMETVPFSGNQDFWRSVAKFNV